MDSERVYENKIQILFAEEVFNHTFSNGIELKFTIVHNRQAITGICYKDKGYYLSNKWQIL